VRPGSTAPPILVSYRREDSADVTGRICDRLVGHFGPAAVFKDVDSIPAGEDFRAAVADAVSRCKVMLVIIGRRWLEVADEAGRRRLDQENDFVRIEVESALKHGSAVLPLLVQGTAMPRPREMPASLETLAYRNACMVRPDPDFHRDMDRLLHRLDELLSAAEDDPPESAGPAAPAQPPPSTLRLIVAVVRGMFQRPKKEPEPRTMEAPAPTGSLCPYCAKLLPTDEAKQCFSCGMDWHDPDHVVRRGHPDLASEATAPGGENFDFLCPSCKKMLQVPKQYAGQLMMCPLCKERFHVPFLRKEHAADPPAHYRPDRLPPEKESELPREVVNSIGMKFVLIPAGKFIMGSVATSDERPEHEVEITRPFYLGIYPVTQEEYERVTGATPSFFSAGPGGAGNVRGLDTRRFPVDRVSWQDAVEFCRRLSDRAEEAGPGRRYRLPTEAEWEYTCRAGAPSSVPFHYGTSLSSTQANFDGNHPGGGARKGTYLGRTTTVGSYPANAFGLYDMHGNVFEWCADWYAEYPRGGVDPRDPQGPYMGGNRVLRGGCWQSRGQNCRAAFRNFASPRDRRNKFGLRVVLVVGAGAG
jgi:formylglycine-generating enzyme required for sulfatase activity